MLPVELYILPSEALDLDALTSALLFAEIWQGLPRPAPMDSALLALWHKYPLRQLRCLLPLPEFRELLWRRDIRYLLHFLGQRYQSGDERDTLHWLFGRAAVSLEYSHACPAESAAFVLLDRHHLPPDWPQSLRVIALWDHRPDNGTVPDAELRCIQPASSCVALLCDCARRLGLWLSEAALILAMATLHLDQRGRLLSWEQPLWQRLARQFPELEPVLDTARRERDSPAADLFEQANTDVKLLHFSAIPNGSVKIAVMVAVVPAGLQVVRRLCEAGALQAFVRRCLQRHDADFLIMLHRQSPQNPLRAISFFFDARDQAVFAWDKNKINFFLLRLQTLFPGCNIYHCGQLPELVQWQPCNQNFSRKAFLPALQKIFRELLQYDI